MRNDQRLGRKPAARIPVFLRVLCAERRPVSLKVIPDHRMHLRFRVQHTPPRANCQCGFRADLCFSRVKREKGGKYPGFFCISTIRTARRYTAAADRQKSAWFRAKMRKIFKNHLDKPCTACYNIERRSERIGYSSLAQSVERVTVNHDVVGSSPTGGAKEKNHPVRVVFSLTPRPAGLKEFAGFASRNRRHIAAEGKLRGGCLADADEPQQGEPGKSTCVCKCFFSYIRLAASDIAAQ